MLTKSICLHPYPWSFSGNGSYTLGGGWVGNFAAISPPTGGWSEVLGGSPLNVQTIIIANELLANETFS